MSTKNVTITLGDWAKLSTLIAAALATDDKPNFPTVCQSLEIISPESNADGTHVDITSDLVDKDIAYRLLKEESKLFESPLRSNNISTMDKLIRIVDAADVVTAGTARVVLNFA
jgi:hypothetical protein